MISGKYYFLMIMLVCGYIAFRYGFQKPPKDSYLVQVNRSASIMFAFMSIWLLSLILMGFRAEHKLSNTFHAYPESKLVDYGPISLANERIHWTYTHDDASSEIISYYKNNLEKTSGWQLLSSKPFTNDRELFFKKDNMLLRLSVVDHKDSYLSYFRLSVVDRKQAYIKYILIITSNGCINEWASRIDLVMVWWPYSFVCQEYQQSYPRSDWYRDVYGP